MKNLKDANKEVNHTYIVNLELERIFSQLKDAETGQRGFLLSNDSLALKPFFEGVNEIPKSLETLRQLTKNNKVQQENLKLLAKSINEKLSTLELAVRSAKFDKLYSNEFKIQFVNDRVKMDTIRKHIA